MSKSGKVALFVVGTLVAGLTTIALLVRQASQPTRGSVLELAVEGEIPDYVEVEGLSHVFGGRRMTLRDDIEALRLAREDHRINGLLVTINGPSLGSGRLQELRDAIIDFQKKGKWAVAYLETAGEFSPGNRDYYLATACGTIWLSPPGDINLVGMRVEPPFIRGTLDLLGIVPDMDHIGKYKSAMNTITDKEMNDSFRESMEALVGSIFGQVLKGIAAGRGMSEEKVSSLVDEGPYIGPRALKAGLVDRLGYRDELESSLKEKNDGALSLIKISSYLKAGRFFGYGPRITLIYALGGVSRGENQSNPFTGEMTMGAETTAAAIRKAREDPSIKAIVFRVDSPGGSYIASDVIYHQVILTKAVKPIVVSMGDVAASGGYFVSMGADKIVAEPATITASIGVLAGKMVTTGFWNKVGITFDSVQRGKHATFFSTGVRYTPEEREIFASWLDRIYKDFVGKAAKGRGRTFEQIHEVAQGRVWSGEDALRLGLVDELGGLTTAIRRALVLARMDPDARVQLVVMPEPRSWFSQFLNEDETRAPFASVRHEVRRFIEEGPSIAPDGVLSMPYVPVIR